MSNKKTTVPNPSVGADGGQPPVKDNTEIVTETAVQSNLSEAEIRALYRKMEEMNQPGYLRTVTLNEIMDTVYPAKTEIVENLLYSGAYLLAGAPKIGKSFLVAQIAYHVSKGLPLWDYKVRQSDVLYLALEDDEGRLQSRMFRMYGVEGTDRLHFAVRAKRLEEGLCEQLNYILNKFPETRLIIVDTLQKIREGKTSANTGYAEDYQVIGELKSFADQHNVCVLVIHHTRKQPDSDGFNTISGTNGLLGAADGALVMGKEKRTSGEAVMIVTGRDQPEQTYHLTKDQERLVWELDYVEAELWKEPPDPLLQSIAEFLTEERTEWSGRATELMEALGLDMQANALSKRLNVRAGKLLSDFGIRYENSHTRNGSRITLKRMT